jgi:hypothetical protein
VELNETTCSDKRQKQKRESTTRRDCDETNIRAAIVQRARTTSNFDSVRIKDKVQGESEKEAEFTYMTLGPRHFYSTISCGWIARMCSRANLRIEYATEFDLACNDQELANRT